MKQKIKGVVMEVQQHQIVLMCDDGTFRNVPREKHDMPVIGEYVTYRIKKAPLLQWNRKMVLPVVSLAAILLFIVMNGSFFQPNQQAYLLAIDINPSIEISLDEDFNVLDIVALNDDANRVIQDLDMEGQKIDKAINEIVVQLKEKQYLSKDTSAIVTTTLIDLQEKDKTESKKLLLVEEIFHHSFAQNQVGGEIEVYAENEQYYQEAKNVSLSVNSYRLYQQMTENKAEVDIEEVKNKTIKELRQMVEKAAEKSGETRNDQQENLSSSKNKEEAPEKNKNRSSQAKSRENSDNSGSEKEHSKQQVKENDGQNKSQNNGKAPNNEEKNQNEKIIKNKKTETKNESPANDKKKDNAMDKTPPNEILEKAEQNQQSNSQKQKDPETPVETEWEAEDNSKSDEKSAESSSKVQNQARENSNSKRKED
ncbi:anti-sigma-I factor RsgI family protein [Gracilibacillus sp. D59]|uniref:anti-sigma-I factor RsgI family protein n=1 Tax=Gracilibacillus sp. D59 TaxID=3457434 RepID=UPI003FCD784C